ncbi:potassium transporter 5 isoform X1 [Ziziphus jujuba]|uniref:Potassium transporter n=2 Tax=Ziziphus jujuba TaxID=326968 RepID=A0A6P4AM00_ZIZJJ|nr:potassium transporter 5 isoform X1 [Ziziphus jujuba]
MADLDDHEIADESMDERQEEIECISQQGIIETQLSPNEMMPSVDIESLCISSNRHGHTSNSKGRNWWVIFQLAVQSLGVVYGDIGTSPLYVYGSTFSKGIRDEEDILGVLSLIFYTLTLIPLIKYIFIVLKATDNGDGGTFALYSFICRHAMVGLTPNEQAEDSEVPDFQPDLPKDRLKRASWIKSKLEKNVFAKYFLLFSTMLGTSMVISDGVLTPCISVLSAVGGIKQATPAMTEDAIVWISVGILVCLFMVQRFGTDKVGYSFAPIMCLWFAFISGIGVYNIFNYDPTVIKAVNPKHIVDYFRRNKGEAWISLGGVVLTITGSEALFADVGHFTVRSIQISMCCVTYPALVLAYTGQASFLRKHTNLVADTFYNSIPGPFYWPMLLVAVLAAITASQAMISGTFCIIQQSLSLECFPPLKIIHTSKKYEGQVYIPEANYILMLACIGVTLSFKSTAKIGNAYGIAVMFVMLLSSCFLVLIMVMVWKTHMLLVIFFAATIGAVELMYLSSVLYKFDQGGYLSLALALALTAMMLVWNNVQGRKYYYELDYMVSFENVAEIVNNSNLCRLPGLAIFHTEVIQGIPPIFKHYIDNVPALHSVIVFVSTESTLTAKVLDKERFVFRRLDDKELIFQCTTRYGYTELGKEASFLEIQILENLKEFIEEERKGQDRSLLETEIEAVDKAWHAGVVHLIGETDLIAGKGSSLSKRILINYAYNFLKKNSRQTDQLFDIPHRRMLKIGMTCEL